MKQTRLLMGMPISVEIVGDEAADEVFDAVYDYFDYVDQKYSTYKPTSEISQINAGLPRDKWSEEMSQVLDLCEQTKRETEGYFNIEHNGKLDPSGLVKGWAIQNAAKILDDLGIQNYYIDAGGDIQVRGHNHDGEKWKIGIRNPFNRDEVVKTIAVTDEGVATSGTYIRGEHIYNPHKPDSQITGIVAITVIGPDIYNADRFATAAYAMGSDAVMFIENLDGYEAYMIDDSEIATYTSGFERYVVAV